MLTLVGTRPEVIRLSRTIALLEQHTEHFLVHSGQSFDYELNGIFFEQLGLRPPDRNLQAAGPSPAITTANVIARLDPVLEELQPEAMLLLGDTNSCLGALAAKRRKIPIFHLEAGNRCYDERVPEEVNRRLIDHLSDIHLTYSEWARRALLQEGVPADRVLKVGSPMFEVLQHYRPQIEASDVRERLQLTRGHYFVVSVHREENVEPEPALRALAVLLERLPEDYGCPVVVSTHPRTRARLDQLGFRVPPQVQLLKPLGFFDYVQLQCGARAVLSDSGTLTEEASILNFRALHLRQTHERQEGMEQAAVILTGLSLSRIYQGLELLEKAPRDIPLLPDYAVPDVSQKVLRILLSYTDYVRRVVWKAGY